MPPPPPSAIVASGFLDASGRARLDERQLQLGAPHRVHLAYAAPPAAGGYGGYASAPPPLVPLMADGLGPAEPASASFIPPLGMNEELPLELRRCTRDLRVVALAAASINPRGDPIAVRVQLRHERMSQVVIAEGDTGAGGASSAGDGGYGGYGIGALGGANGCVLRGAIYVGETYILQAPNEPPMRVTGAAPLAGRLAEPQMIELRVSSSSSSSGSGPGARALAAVTSAPMMTANVVPAPRADGVLPPPTQGGARDAAPAISSVLMPGVPGARWYDERPAAEGAERRAEEDARRMQDALGKKDQGKILALLRGKSMAELQLMRRAYSRTYARELSELLAKRSELEGLLLLTKPELDMRTLKTALAASASSKKDVKAAATTSILELLCTSLPSSLLELQEEWRRTERVELQGVLRRQLDTPEERRLGAHESALPLLLALLERADEAARGAGIGGTQIVYDVFRALDKVPPGQSDVLRTRLFPLLAGLGRIAIADLARDYRRRYECDILDEVGTHLRGPLSRAVWLLLTPTETYYARKLHAAFDGLAKTPELLAFGLVRLGKKDETLVSIVGSRFGRDLSGIATQYHSQYQASLVEAIVAKTTGDMRKVLREVVEGCLETAQAPAAPPAAPAPLVASAALPAAYGATSAYGGATSAYGGASYGAGQQMQPPGYGGATSQGVYGAGHQMQPPAYGAGAPPMAPRSYEASAYAPAQPVEHRMPPTLPTLPVAQPPPPADAPYD